MFWSALTSNLVLTFCGEFEKLLDIILSLMGEDFLEVQLLFSIWQVYTFPGEKRENNEIKLSAYSGYKLDFLHPLLLYYQQLSIYLFDYRHPAAAAAAAAHFSRVRLCATP